MRLTVCELSDDASLLESEWLTLNEHLRTHRSDALVLPEMPFYPWFADREEFDGHVWFAALRAHDSYVSKLTSLETRFVLATRPIARGDSRLNQAFVWDGSYRAAREKRMLPTEPGYLESAWFDRGEPAFPVVDVGEWRAGFLICTELWSFERARHYGTVDGVDLIVNPRATQRASTDVWLAGGRSASVVAGAYCASSNRRGATSWGEFGGTGWITDPDGTLLATTSKDQPFTTVEIDISAARRAKSTYPRNVRP